MERIWYGEILLVILWLCSSVEKLSLPDLGVLIEMLSENRGALLEAVCGKVSQIVTAIEDRRDLDKRYKLENIIGASLKKERSDSSRFIEYFEMDTDNHPRHPDRSDHGPQEPIRVINGGGMGRWSDTCVS